MFSLMKPAAYARIQDEEGIEFSKPHHPTVASSCRMSSLWIFQAFIFLTSLFLFIESRTSPKCSSEHGSESAHFDAALWSKSLSSIPISETKFRGSFLQPSEYRGASPSANEAWDRFTLNPFVDGTAVVLGVTEEDIRRSNKLDDGDWFNTTVVLDPNSDRSQIRYMATLELFHQVHCLDMLRKSTFGKQFHDDFGWKHGPEMLRNHLDHCLEMIRQVIMCNSDPRLITFHWVKDNPVPYPDFNTWHQCRNADATLQWAKENEWHLDHVVVKKGAVIEMPEAP